MTTLMQVTGIEAGYGTVSAISGVSFEARAGEVTALLGSNGAGKTTAMLTVSGLLRLRAGDIRVDGQSVAGLPNDAIVRRGIVQVPQGRQVFPAMSVRANLMMGAFTRRRMRLDRDLERIFDAFPRLRDRAAQLAGTLSGGEQQMVAIGRALMAQPRVLLLDEPSLGLAPVVVHTVYATLRKLAAEGLALVLAEQNVAMALDVATSVCLIKNGTVFAAGGVDEMRAGDLIAKAYLS